MQRVAEPFPLYSSTKVARALETQASPIHIGGVHAPLPLALLLAHPTQHRLCANPHLIVTASLDVASALEKEIRFFEPHTPVHILPAFDVSPYSGLYPSPKIIAQRLRWIHRAMDARPGEIFIAVIEGLLQKTIPFDLFARSVFRLARGFEFPASPAELFNQLGYHAAPSVEDVGTYAIRGGIIDIYSPAHDLPLRLELFGDTIETLRFFNPVTQTSVQDTNLGHLIPAREVLYRDEHKQKTATLFSHSFANRPTQKEETAEMLRSITLGQYFFGIEFLLPYFYDHLSSPLDFFNSKIDLWYFERNELLHANDQIHRDVKNAFSLAETHAIRPLATELYSAFEALVPPEDSSSIYIERVDLVDNSNADNEKIQYRSSPCTDFIKKTQSLLSSPDELVDYVREKISEWRNSDYQVFFATSSHSLQQRLKTLLEKAGFHVSIQAEDDYAWASYLEEQKKDSLLLHLIPRALSSDARLPDDKIIFLRDTDVFGRRGVRTRAPVDQKDEARGAALSFGELNVGDPVVHKIHGVGIYQGLKVMSIDGASSEFIELTYKDKDRLYLPTYRIGQLHKFVGPSSAASIDKLGGTSWQKTKTKVRHALRDIASKLLALYAKRSQVKRPHYLAPDEDYWKFENTFPYQETPDQLRAIEDVLQDFAKDTPADRLICGDVGFGKTEVAMRAAFSAVESKRQVAIIAPTTILTFQHYENFKKRFAPWPIEIRVLNRFVSSSDVKKTVFDVKEGRVDIVIGTHRLLSKDIAFKDLGLLIVDEEQKFGVAHKEKLRMMREAVDTIALSATPIPRTLNMSLVGLRDISFVNTPPEDRLPTRTFVSRFDDELIRKSIEGEIARGGQVFFLHNRVQTIDEVAGTIREIVPNARIAVAHGQMDEDLLEKTILRFFNHELDVLVCTAIIESGMDIPRANTIFIDNAHTFGVSQLYQLRGRVGRSKERAYCYLLIPAGRKIDPIALERLKVIQENTALGSGVRVAQYDLELRGAGDFLGEDQSGHIDAIGYELFLELLDEAIQAERGLPAKAEAIEPEINLRISALIPDTYIPDLRMRLYYYKTLSNIKDAADLDLIESELRDQFGEPPEQVLNLLGVMLVRKLCRDLGVRDISAGAAFVSLSFTDQTPLPTQAVLDLTSRLNKKYQLTPTQSLKIRINEITWPRVVDELEYLLSQCPRTQR